MFSKRKIIIINFEFRLSSLPPPPLNGIEPSLITNSASNKASKASVRYRSNRMKENDEGWES